MPTDRTIEEIVSGTAAVLQGIAGPLPGGGAGVVFDRPRHTISQDIFKDTFLDTDDRLRGTDIEVGSPNEFEDEARHKYWVIWPLRISHYRHFTDDANTFLEFWRETEKIKDTLRQNASVFGVPHRPEVQRVAQVETTDLVMFGNIMAHRAVLVTDVETSEVKSP